MTHPTKPEGVSIQEWVLRPAEPDAWDYLRDQALTWLEEETKKYEEFKKRFPDSQGDLLHWLESGLTEPVLEYLNSKK